ncbi:hypothetical protein [Christensenella tenuis]|uniref:CNNM transmembrane domain-containing protein n=1 Tax=Christensenella tenuis TaxID=2763033 RepID=A0ABR7ED13_9FIRM|nr:hypothetical protein [Christensenella tenuis]MBC5647211.1 hypothetical protein [Christensenella tenuis]
MKVIKHWTIKIFFITLFISAGVSVAAEYFISNLSLPASVGILAALIAVGVLFDIVGVAFASCDQAPFIAMSAKKNAKAHYALKMLKNADVVSNFCNDVIGDICGIVSGAAGAAITLKALVFEFPFPDLVVSIAISALIAAATVAGKAWGKTIALRKNKDIVLAIGTAANFFSGGRKKNEKEN